MLIAVSCWWLVVSLLRDSHHSTIRVSSSSVGVARGVGSTVIVVVWACIVALVHSRRQRLRRDASTTRLHTAPSVSGIELKAAAAVNGLGSSDSGDGCGDPASASTSPQRHGVGLGRSVARADNGDGGADVRMNPLFQARDGHGGGVVTAWRRAPEATDRGVP
jgi:hypothetical protein